ncbi:MAG: methyltransferase [Alphaproteobacteria bacterium]|nr:MAG: methyltransferase [Alphaproteobacteria bacterium]
MDPAIFVRQNTAITSPPLVPEIRLHLATEITPIWLATEESLARSAVPPPFWAFAWAGGQTLARYILDHPAEISGRFVLDFGAGSGLVAIAAAKAGAAPVLAAEIDHFAAAAIAINAALNDVAVTVTTADVIDTADPRWEVVGAYEPRAGGPRYPRWGSLAGAAALKRAREPLWPPPYSSHALLQPARFHGPARDGRAARAG